MTAAAAEALPARGQSVPERGTNLASGNRGCIVTVIVRVDRCIGDEMKPPPLVEMLQCSCPVSKNSAQGGGIFAGFT